MCHLSVGHKKPTCRMINQRVVAIMGGVVVDWDRVTELREEIGMDDFDEVFALFLEEADEAVARLLQATDARAMESDLHFLKGSALNLGLGDLAHICQIFERSAATGQVGFPLSEISDCYGKSRVALEEGLAKARAA